MQIEIQQLPNQEVELTVAALESRPDETPDIVVRKARGIAMNEAMSYSQSVRLAMVCAEAYVRARRSVEAVEVLRPRMRDVDEADSRYWRARAAERLACLYAVDFGDFDAAAKLYGNAVTDFESAGERDWVATTSLQMGLVHRAANNLVLASDAFSLGLKFCSQGTPPLARANLYAAQLTTLNDLSQFDLAAAQGTQALQFVENHNTLHPGVQASLYAEVGLARAGIGEKRTAEQYFALAQSLARTSGDPQTPINIGLVQARLFDRVGKPQKAVDLLTELSVRCTENRLLLAHFDVLRAQLAIAKASRNFGAALGAMEAISRIEARLQAERNRLKLAEAEVHRSLDSAQAFARKMQEEIQKKTQTLERTIAQLEKEAEQREASEKRNEFLAGHDVATGLATRRRLASRIETDIVKRNADQAFGVMLVHIETTSGLLSRAGVARTDELLAQAAKVVQQNLPGAYVARFSDFTFACLCGPFSREDVAGRCAEAGEIVCAALNQPIDVGGKPMSLRASAGIAVCERTTDTVAALLGNADAALQKARGEFESRACIFDEVLEKQEVRKRNLETDLDNADSQSGIHVVFQPLVDAHSHRVKGFESLVRWQHSTYGKVPPVEFIPIAETGGAIERLGLVIAELALEDFGKVLRPAFAESYVTVNVSMLQLRDTHFASNMLAVCRKTRVEPTSVVLEITESQIGEDNPTIHANLKRLRLHGFRLAIDDFGTGYSSLWRLGQIDMQTIKIARELVVGAHLSEAAGMLLVRAVQICHDLGRTVVAEGIEGDQERENAVNAGCDQLQGYMFARPMSASELVTHMAWANAGDVA